jgi:hypothetical protein
VGGQEEDLVVGLDLALLEAAGEHIADTLDLVHARDGEAHGNAGADLALGDSGHVVEGVQEAVDLKEG